MFRPSSSKGLRTEHRQSGPEDLRNHLFLWFSDFKVHESHLEDLLKQTARLPSLAFLIQRVGVQPENVHERQAPAAVANVDPEPQLKNH
jgi:hypothetical protein